MCTFAVNETISYYKNSGSNVYVLFLDASKAFDRLNYVKLFNKLLSRNMCPITVRLLLKMYLNQKIQVNWNGKLSQPFCVTNGVKQGGVLSPLFFSVYIDELLIKLKNTGIGCHIGNHYYGALGYADDIVLICPTKGGLKKLINVCETYAAEHNIIFNGNKSKLLLFGNSPGNVNNISVNGVPVPVCESAMHLGNVISSNIFDSVNYGISKFNASFNYFMSSFGICQSSVKNKLFVQYCTSFYGSQIWPIYNTDTINKISVKWRIALRRIWNLQYNTHCDLLPLIASQAPIDIQLKCRFLKFYRSAINSENTLIKYLSNRMTCAYKSTMSNNLRQILCDLNIEISELDKFSLNDIKKMYYDKWESNIDQQYIVHSKVIHDLCMIKEKVYTCDIDLKVYQCDLIIKFLCTL
ncbi:unnamed protein product [Meganyctiphanes norvegica]|uniref:Reverse transcriptase domain-containing protein n=2 Tax=Meganyctiphanes norvegica TaxID=48144 RepID=A0AAV2QVA4_MEGNR